eukprot:CAMPEP_0183332542 /NCGR_PEP_ID=MMETSP0164_2-20130417/1677_1 /TAXON_ID=221442 /ORGANISM="Coccolithus pelagicus ssp braarudi, Strain PLY182g" /LENGTH=154 /DNA_ID=CAMNT_0025501281 /DNA_START=164 /DNA_END=625 /DNA_ORIENTATION=+
MWPTHRAPSRSLMRRLAWQERLEDGAPVHQPRAHQRNPSGRDPPSHAKHQRAQPARRPTARSVSTLVHGPPAIEDAPPASCLSPPDCRARLAHRPSSARTSASPLASASQAHLNRQDRPPAAALALSLVCSRLDRTAPRAGPAQAVARPLLETS